MNHAISDGLTRLIIHDTFEVKEVFMTHWYQKEYVVGELRKALWETVYCFSSRIFKAHFLEKESLVDDSTIFRLMLQELCVLATTTPNINLILEQGSFMLKGQVGQGGVEGYYKCKKTATGWLFKVGGKSTDFGVKLKNKKVVLAVEFGWQKLSNEHPLESTTIIGPSRQQNFCGKDTEV